VLPGTSWLLPPGLGRKAAGILAHGGANKAGTLSGTKGTTTVAPGVNAFASPATSAPGTGIASDGRLGTGAVSYSNSTYAIPASVGTQVGGNLFESFGQFNLLQGESADFQGPSSVQNILARVTGGSASSIDGTIQSDIQGANLFLINPSGVMFGPDASLNVSGAFTVSTADYLTLADGGRFNSSLGGNDMLTAAAVSAFGFVNPSPAAVSVNGSTLTAAAGEAFSIVAGDITLIGSKIDGDGSRINLLSVGSSGEAFLSAADPTSSVETRQFATMGDILMTQSAAIDTSGVTGGEVAIRCANLTLDEGSITSTTSGATNGNPIDIVARESVTLTDTGRATDIELFTSSINTHTSGSAAAGNVLVTSPLIVLELGGGIGSSAEGSTTASASGGRIVLDCNVLDILDEFSVVDVDTGGLGAGGQIIVTANIMNIIGDPAQNDPGGFTGLIAETGNINQLIPTGRGGDILVNAGSVFLGDGGILATTILGSGNAGDIRVNATSVTIGDAGGILTRADHFSTGNAGSIFVQAQSLVMLPGALVYETTLSIGAGGTITLEAKSIDIDGGVVTAESDPSPYGAPDGGQGGSVTLTAQEIRICNYGEVDASTDTSGNGGSVRVDADDVNIAGDSIISASSFSSTQTGAAGNVVVNAVGDLDIEDGGEIDCSTFGLGKGGSANVRAQNITISGASPGSQFSTSGIFAGSDSSAQGGPAGNVIVKADGTLLIEAGGEINSSTDGLGKGGAVTITAQDITISGVTGDGVPSEISAGSYSSKQGGAAGTVAVNAAGTLDLESGGQINSSTLGLGNGGDVNVTAQDINISGGSGILANSVSRSQGGVGGDIMMTANEDLSLNDGGVVAANSVAGNAGDITINAGTDAILEGQSSISCSAGISGGSIELNIGGLLYILDSSITATAGILRNPEGVLHANFGNGGNIILDPEFIVLDDGLISANAAMGQGGNIVLESNYYLNSGSTITATGFVTGIVPNGDVGEVFVGLPSAPVGSESQLQETCAVAMNGDFSSFLAVGQGDVEAGPDEAQGGTGDDSREQAGYRKAAHRR
jgi:filamentous hemagglutinin family protein